MRTKTFHNQIRLPIILKTALIQRLSEPHTLFGCFKRMLDLKFVV